MDSLLQKLIYYCRYQERCHKEVKQKLAALNCYGTDADSIVADLIEQGYLNEERFARAFARGKFRMLHWGKVKIAYELRNLDISPLNLKTALTEIADEEYEGTATALIHKKAGAAPKGAPTQAKQQAIMRYMLQKGYEPAFVTKLLKTKL